MFKIYAKKCINSQNLLKFEFFKLNQNNIYETSYNIKKFCDKSSKSDSSDSHTPSEKEFLKLDYYSILNINKNASDTDIKKSYFVLAKKFHPDKFKGSPEIFRKISDAYNTLRDPHKREEYNKRMKHKIKKKYGKHKDDEKSDSKDKTQNMQEFSKYEEDFKKLNIDKLFTLFTHKKIRTTPDQIKVKKNL
jgi:hypothetical protein